MQYVIFGAHMHDHKVTFDLTEAKEICDRYTVFNEKGNRKPSVYSDDGKDFKLVYETRIN